MTDDGHGKVHGRFTLPTLQAAELKKMLLALAAPKHLAATDGPGVERRPGPERMGRAFMELIDRISAKDLPKVARSDATIVVTIDLDTLTGRLQKAGILDTGEQISANAARRLACTARIIPVVLGGDSEVLDLGRARRFFTRAQTTAMSLRDEGCVAEGCDWPPWMCHAHHWTRWSDGGTTDLDQRRPPLPPTPRPSPRPDLRDAPTSPRQGHLPPTALSRQRSHLPLKVTGDPGHLQRPQRLVRHRRHVSSDRTSDWTPTLTTPGAGCRPPYSLS